MKKILFILFAILLVSCGDDPDIWNDTGIVSKVSFASPEFTSGKYIITVNYNYKNYASGGQAKYSFVTNQKYYVGDTIRIR